MVSNDLFKQVTQKSPKLLNSQKSNSFSNLFRSNFMEESSSNTNNNNNKINWGRAQDLLKRRLILQDDFTWKIKSTTTSSSQQDEDDDHVLRYVGGVDLSFSKHDPSMACAALVVLDLQVQDDDDVDGGFKVVYHDFSVTHHLQIPYIPGFLAFREAPILLQLLDKMKSINHPFYPQCLMVDGNGLLHPRGFGLACHLGVEADLPTIGVGKNLHHVDGLTQSGVRQLLQAKENTVEDLVTLTGSSGRVWGAALRSTQDSLKPIFISIGHRISLETAIAVVKLTCKYRVPEPIRQADIRSRYFLQKNQGVIKKECD